MILKNIIILALFQLALIPNAQSQSGTHGGDLIVEFQAFGHYAVEFLKLHPNTLPSLNRDGLLLKVNTATLAPVQQCSGRLSSKYACVTPKLNLIQVVIPNWNSLGTNYLAKIGIAFHEYLGLTLNELDIYPISSVFLADVFRKDFIDLLLTPGKINHHAQAFNFDQFEDPKHKSFSSFIQTHDFHFSLSTINSPLPVSTGLKFRNYTIPNRLAYGGMEVSCRFLNASRPKMAQIQSDQILKLLNVITSGQSQLFTFSVHEFIVPFNLDLWSTLLEKVFSESKGHISIICNNTDYKSALYPSPVRVAPRPSTSPPDLTPYTLYQIFKASGVKLEITHKEHEKK